MGNDLEYVMVLRVRYVSTHSVGTELHVVFPKVSAVSLIIVDRDSELSAWNVEFCD